MTRRMINPDLILTARFMNLPPIVQTLYYLLILHADDDGFVGYPLGVCYLMCADESHLAELVRHGFVHQFASGTAVILHWKQHNKIAPSKKKATVYTKELAQLVEDEHQVYRLRGDTAELPKAAEQVGGETSADLQQDGSDLSADLQQNGSESAAKPLPIVCTGEESIGEESRVQCRRGEESSAAQHSAAQVPPSPPPTPPTPPTKEEIQKFARENGITHVDIDRFYRYYTDTAWHTPTGTPVRWRVKLRDWESEDIKRTTISSPSSPSSPHPKSAECSFDVDDFFAAALSRTYADMPGGVGGGVEG